MTDTPQPQAVTPLCVDAFCPICGQRVEWFYPASGNQSAYVMPCGDQVYDEVRYTVRIADPGGW